MPRCDLSSYACDRAPPAAGGLGDESGGSQRDGANGSRPVTGRHSGPDQSRGLPNPALALGALFLAAVVISAILIQVSRHPASTSGPAAAAGGGPQHAVRAPASPSASGSASAAPPAAGPAPLPDPFGPAAATFLGGRSGTVLAAVDN